MYPQLCLEPIYIKKMKIFLMKFSSFASEKYLCILHGQVFVMKMMKSVKIPLLVL